MSTEPINTSASGNDPVPDAVPPVEPTTTTIPDTPASPPTDPAAKTYTEAELTARLADEKQVWVQQQAEEARLANLSPEDRAKVESDATTRRVAELEAQLLRRDLQSEAVTRLTKEGCPAELAELLTYTSKETMEQTLTKTMAAFRSAVEAGIKERLRGKTPAGLGGAANAENALVDQIASAVKGV